MNLLEWKPEEKPHLGKQTQAVYDVMSDGAWWTFHQLTAVIYAMHHIGISEAGVSARIRDLRKQPLNLTVERQKTNRRGIFQYRLVA